MFINIKIDLAVKICAISIPVFLVLYFMIFRKYNKRNNISWQEIIFDSIEFVANSIIHLFVFILGIDYMIEGWYLLDAIYERYANFIVGVLIISGSIYHYILYIKNLLKDVDQDFAKKENERIYKIGEYFIFLFLCILLINPIINLPKFAMHIADKPKMIKEILISLCYSAAAIFLLYHINPLRIVEKADNKTQKSKNGIISELKEEANKKVDIEETSFKEVNDAAEKMEDVYNDATLNMPDTKKIIIPDEAELEEVNKVKNSKSTKKKSVSSTKKKTEKKENKNEDGKKKTSTKSKSKK